MKTMKSFRLSPLTEQILVELAEKYNCSQADVIAESVYMIRELLISPEDLIGIRAKYLAQDFGKKW